MADWPALAFLILLISAGLTAALLVLVFGVRQLVRRVRARRRLADATEQQAAVRLPADTTLHAFPIRPAAPMPPTRLATPPAPVAPAPESTPGKHSVDTDTVRIPAVPALDAPTRGHRAATPDHPANAPRTTDSGGHRVHRSVEAGTPAGARLTTSPR